MEIAKEIAKEITNGAAAINEILQEQVPLNANLTLEANNYEWPDSVHHQSWHDSWRNSHK